MLANYLVQQCILVDTVRNEYSDYIEDEGTTLPCRFREISSIRRTTYAEMSDTDAMLWLKANAPVIVGSIIKFEDVFYQIERLNKARRLGETNVQFLKCELKITDISVS